MRDMTCGRWYVGHDVRDVVFGVICVGCCMLDGVYRMWLRDVVCGMK